MSELVIVKGEDGKLQGLGEKGRRAYEKFRKKVAELEVGETLKFSYKLPRSPGHHRFFFGKLAGMKGIPGLLARQEVFEDLDHLLEWLKVGAGHVDFLPGPGGVMVAIPRSIAWDQLEEQDFIEFTRAMNDFLWTDYAQATLWPHLSDEQRHACIESWHRDFER